MFHGDAMAQDDLEAAGASPRSPVQQGLEHAREAMRAGDQAAAVANGVTLPVRGLWTPLEDGRVRQFFEQSNDAGETWVTWFDGFYTRKDNA